MKHNGPFAVREPTTGKYLAYYAYTSAYLVNLNEGKIATYPTQGGAKAFANNAEKFYRKMHDYYLNSDYSRHPKEYLHAEFRKAPVPLEVVPLNFVALDPVKYK